MPIRLHPDNPHYLELDGKPAVLVGSGEHYGAVMNLDFDYLVYLDALRAAGLNQTRLFSGTYREVPGSFNIKHNTLAPKPERYLGPWARSADGAGRFDLSRFEPAYFARLRDFVGQAGRRGIVVEVVLFCYFYNEPLWQASPMCAAGNVNGKGGGGPTDAYRVGGNDLLDIQRAFVRRLVEELNPFANLYYEIINEPYVRFDGEWFEEWQELMVRTIVEQEAALPHRHLIARNVYNRTYRIERLPPEVSVLNFHYLLPSAVHYNYHLDRVVSDDETGFSGQEDAPYRREAWSTLLSGGAIVSHLDYSFSVEHPDGTNSDLGATPGGGGPALRRQLRALKEFLEGFDLPRLRPRGEILRRASFTGAEGGAAPPAAIHILGDSGREYAAYIDGGAKVSLDLGLPRGGYRAEWVSPLDGSVLKAERFTALPGSGERSPITSPDYLQDIALRIVRETPG